MPLWTSTVATGPRLRSTFASITTPLAGLCGFAFSSWTSATRQDHLEQIVEPEFLARRDLDERDVAAPLLGHHLELAELLLDAVGVGRRQVDLVDRHDHRHAGRLDVGDRLAGGRHHAVVGGDDEDGDVGRLGAAGAHGGERLVARRVEEGDLAALRVDLVGADVLGDAAGLALGDVGRADRVEQLGLAVVDVAHDRHHRRPRRGRWGRCRPRPAGSRSRRSPVGTTSGTCSLVSQPSAVATRCGGVEVDLLVDVGHDADLHQFLDDLDAGCLQIFGQFGHRHHRRQRDRFADDRRGGAADGDGAGTPAASALARLAPPAAAGAAPAGPRLVALPRD